MAKFCGKCGGRLDPETGLCPKCDAQRIEKLHAGLKKEDETTLDKNKKQEQTKGKRKAKGLLRGIIAVLCIVLAGFAVMLVIKKKNISPINLFKTVSENVWKEDLNKGLWNLEGNFTQEKIVDEKTAIKAVQESVQTSNYKNAFDELEPIQTITIEDETYYKLQQYYKGIPVFGRSVTVAATVEGKALGMITDATDIDDVDIQPTLTQDVAREKVREYAAANWGIVCDDLAISELSDDQLVIYQQNNQAQVAYKITVFNENEYTVILDAKTGDVLEEIPNVYDAEAISEDGTLKSAAKYENDSDTYYILNPEKNLLVFDLHGISSKSKDWNKKIELVKSVGDNIFGNTEDEKKQMPNVAMSYLNSIEEITDYFQKNFNQGIPFGSIWLLYNDGYDSGLNATGGPQTYNTETTIGIMTLGKKYTGNEKMVLAHEYIHIVTSEYNSARGSGSETEAIQEGLADVFAMFYAGKWELKIPYSGLTRSAIEPQKYGHADSANKFFMGKEDYKHRYATVISHAAYIMSQSNAFSAEKLQKLWYKTMIQLPYDCTYSDLKFCMMHTAKIMKCSNDQKAAIEDAFNQVDIQENYECNNAIAVNVYDKEGNIYDDYSIVIEGQTSTGLWGLKKSDYKKTIEHQGKEPETVVLENGNYAIKVIDNANKNTVKEFDISVSKSNSEEKLYASDFGADYTVAPNATLKVLGADGNELADYTATAYKDEESYPIQNGTLDLAEHNYYVLVLSQKDEAEHKTYYKVLSVRLLNGKTDSLKVKSGFPEKKEKDIPAGAVEFNGHYYYVYSEDYAADWNEARAFCEEQGGYLATITSAEEDEFIFSYMTQNGYASAWFGLSNQNQQGDWQWVTGEKYSYQNWHPGEPNNQGGYEHYGMYYEKNTDGSWNDGNGMSCAFVCEWGESLQEEQEQTDEVIPTVTHSQEREIVLTLDISSSMEGTPIEETCKASVNFVNTILKEEAGIGVVTYNTNAYRASDFSTDQDALNNEIMNIDANGRTNISSGLQEAYSMLSEGNAKKKIIVLMSDGLPNEGMGEEELVAYADTIKQAGVRIYTLGFFEKLSNYEKSGAQDLMERIASDGCHYEVENADDLVFFFEDMADQINGQKYIYVRIACPVDVQVTYQGQTLSSAEDEQNLRTDFGTLTFEQNWDAEDSQNDERIKVLRLKEGADYDLQIVGTGHGLMNYTIGFMDEDGNYSDLRKFEDVKINKKTVIDTVAAVSDQSVLNIDQDGDGRYDLKLYAGENGYGKEMKPNYSILVLMGGSAIFIMVFVAIIVIKKKKG